MGEYVDLDEQLRRIVNGEMARFYGIESTNGTRPPALIDLDELLALDEEPYDWLIPGLLERHDRVILTGIEGQGKSTLLRQFGTQAASGIHPFTLERIDPVRSVLVDCENSQRQVRRKVAQLRTAAGDAYSDRRLLFEFRPDGIDLTKGDDYGWLCSVLREAQPDLLVIGPAYKLANGDPKDEQVAKAVSVALDRIRVEFGCAVLLEAHTPYEDGSKSKRPERPYGASLWSRWPEFGLFLDPEGHIRHWRGQRDEREWPVKLERGEPWPWMVTEAGASIESDDPWRPTHCIDAIVALCESQPDRTFSTKQLADTLRLGGEGYRVPTVAFSAETAAKEQLLSVRVGPRNARLFQALPVDNLDLVPPSPTYPHIVRDQVEGEGDDLVPHSPGGGYYVPPDCGTRSEPPSGTSGPPVPKRDLY